MTTLEHSIKGSTWKNHKYIRKEGDRYIYPRTKQVSGSYTIYSRSPDYSERAPYKKRSKR